MGGIAALAFTALFVVAATTVRGSVALRARRGAAVKAAWTPVFVGAVREVPDEVPRIGRRDRAHVLELWNRFCATLEGGARDRLDRTARTFGIDRAALELVERGRGAERLLAAITLGRLRDARGVRTLLELAARNPLVLRAEATRALVRIDPEAGTRAVVPLVASWRDCHPATAVAVLDEAPPEVVSAALADEVLEAPDVQLRTRLVEMLGRTRGSSGVHVVHRILETTDEPEVTARCLEVIREHRRPGDAALVRPYLEHPVSFVRVQAVSALGRLRVSGDEWRIVARLDDREWWVRYRAAHALTAMPSMSRSVLALLARTHPDRYARGALAQVLSETAALS